MKAKTKALVLAVCAVLLVVTTVFVTMAYLTSTTETVTNTFTVGKVGISLDEAKVDEYGSEMSSASRVTSNTYKLIPNHTYTKDPTVYVDSESEESWLFVKVTNEITAIEKSGDTTIAEQMKKLGWTAVDGAENVYAYKESVKANDEIKVFESFTVDESVESGLSGYDNAKITIIAYAVQKDGFDTAADAWAETFGK